MAGRKVFQDSIVALPAHPGLTAHGLIVASAEPDHTHETMDIAFSLDLGADATAQLEAAIANGRTIPVQEQKDKFSPKGADIQALVAWLKAEGFEVTHVSPQGTGIYARATVGQISKSLGVKMVRVTSQGVTCNAAQDAPSMPSEVAGSVRAIVGLQPFVRANKHLRRSAPIGLSDGSVMHTNAAGQFAPPFKVPAILKAYDADGLGVTGRGQTIAILIDTFPLDSDLQAFWTANGLPVTLAQIEKINVPGGALPPVEGEETLDVSWTSGIAPGAKIRVYASGSLEFVALDLALDRILTDLATRPEMRQLSISLGLGEQFMGGPQGEVATQHQKYLRLAAAGVNIFVSSGDAGSNPDDSGHSSTGPTQAEYGASDSAVIGVGGTSLRLKPDGSLLREKGWTGSGGGKSIFFPRPPWQKGIGVPAGPERLVPDVALVADPQTGAFLVVHGLVQQTGGTSWSAPVWAGFCALMNEARANAGKPALPFLNPLIYPLLGTAAFRDIKSGSNGGFPATAGYDLVTGLGVPSVRTLIAKLP